MNVLGCESDCCSTVYSANESESKTAEGGKETALTAVCSNLGKRRLLLFFFFFNLVDVAL